MSGTVLVFSGGDALTPDEVAELPDEAIVVAADSGIDRAHAAGRTVDIAVGDFDSVTAAGLRKAEASGATIERHPSSKDETDLELALQAAMRHEPERLVVAAMAGGRPDHELAAFGLLTDPALAVADVDVVLPRARLAVVHRHRTFTGRIGDVLSLVPIGGDAVGVTTNGLRYPLHDETLHTAAGRGVSNQFAAPMAVVSLTSGVLFAFQPDPEWIA